MLINIDKTNINKLSITELNIAKWINEHSNNIWKYSITEIANETYTSTATVSRLIKKCGYSGISELKFSATNKINDANNYEKINKIISDLSKECNETINSFRIDDIQKIIREIKSSKRIVIVARGNTALIARFFEFQLMLLGYNVALVSDSVILNSSEKFFKKTDLVIIFTVKNSTPELEVAARNAKANNSKIVTCSCIEETSLKQYSDIYIGARNENQSIIEKYNMKSNLPLHLISRIIVYYLVEDENGFL